MGADKHVDAKRGGDTKRRYTRNVEEIFLPDQRLTVRTNEAGHVRHLSENTPLVRTVVHICPSRSAASP